MKKLLYGLLLASYAMSNMECSKTTAAGSKEPANDLFNIPENKVVAITADTTSLIRNPAMGWVMYDDANDPVANAATYWAAQNEAALKYASVFYIRWRWNSMEPEEGKYAWLYDDNFKALVKGARDRGLKLAFRIYIDGQDNSEPGTPNYVKQAGAQGYDVDKLGGGKNWTPYLDDPIFQQKFTTFIHAFAAAFDNPTEVDYVDGYNLGWWGEGHHLVFKDEAKKEAVFNWIINLYGASFKKVLLAITFGSQIGLELEAKEALDGNGYVLRRDGVGSTWFLQTEKDIIDRWFPKVPFIAESCYWGCNTADCRPWATDPTYGQKWTGWKDVYTQTYNDALSAHANTLDLREVVESKGWTTIAPELVKGFVRHGGYRFVVSQLSIPATIRNGSTFKIGHYWKNLGVGMCPNNNPRWNHKYKVAFALINKTDQSIAAVIKDDKADPATWIKGKDGKYVLEAKVNVPAGTYTLGVAIIDTTQEDKPGIQLAVDKATNIKGWTTMADIIIQP
jgi:hypothetical protein